jgi:hypothetical protein
MDGVFEKVDGGTAMRRGEKDRRLSNLTFFKKGFRLRGKKNNPQ